MLAPFVLVFALSIRVADVSEEGLHRRPPLVPCFVLAFLVFAAANSIGLIPEALAQVIADLSAWALLLAIAAVGIKTSLRSILDVGGQAIALIVFETLFIARFILAGVAPLTG